MVPMDASVNSALFLICSLSPSAADAIDQELYRSNTESDESTQDHILGYAVRRLLDDLSSIGVVHELVPEDLEDDTSSLFSFLTFVSYLLPNTLYTQMKADRDLYHLIGRILDGSVCDGDSVSILESYLSELGGLEGQQAYYPDLTDTIDRYSAKLTQSALFSDYLRNVYQLVGDEALTIASDQDAHDGYRTRIKDIIARFADGVNQFEGAVFFDDLIRLQRFLIQDLSSPVNFISYSYLFNESPQTLPEALVAGWDKRWYHFKVSHPWCADYYTVRKLSPAPYQIAAIHCFLYALSMSRDVYQDERAPVDRLFNSDVVAGQIINLYPKA